MYQAMTLTKVHTYQGFCLLFVYDNYLLSIRPFMSYQNKKKEKWGEDLHSAQLTPFNAIGFLKSPN